MITFGCIGCGNMGSAILGGLESQKNISLIGYDPSGNVPCTACDSNIELAKQADIIMLATKPDYVESVLEAIQPALSEDKVIISIAAGVSMETLMKYSGGKCPVVRCMPNTPAMVGEGIFAFCFEDPALTEKQQTTVLTMFEQLGQVMVLPEAKFNAFTAIAGCGPAYVLYFIEAVTEAAVSVGFHRNEATEMAINLFKGTTKLADDSDLHISQLREMVCSPAGVTIAAVNHMDRTAVRGNIIDSIFEARDRGIEMSK
ncbi:pyrroline-5-carboxylate reductase [Halodesulfovibrio sp.]|jgi:pyrroline-5-carboxylate reductase|uniref:pyrroline-5-carboxylate reductase n=1 Tax=Halodesulfovibrio sp. TaxID=1912772 RepID=UPI0025E23141|nr:pyrroline-5-carboxylate reductase [Halodesulfovibrio sp.]MCT4536056.1 pyrroline-5-carboxylate reductase [Halodesulfovibrio sp.]